MKSYRLLFLKALGGALCLAFSGCSGESSEPQTGATPQPSASATARETSERPDQSPANDLSASGNEGTDPEEEGEAARLVTLPTDETLEKSTDMTLMNVEPGTERFFQNTPNEAEIAYARNRHQERAKARAAAIEARKNDANDGNDAPVMNPGGVGELVQVGP